MHLQDLAGAIEDVAWVSRAVVLDEVDSTNLEARRRLAVGADTGLVVVAGRQTAGRGRRGRTWQDVAGGNVAVSAVVVLPAAGSLVPLAAALALRTTLEGLGLRTALKWPNDVQVVVDGVSRKCAGILAESVPGGPTVPDRVVVGIGVDLDWRGQARDESSEAWTSVAEALDRDVRAAEVVPALVRHLGDRIDSLAHRSGEVLADYRAACDTLGRRVRVDGESRVLVGRAVDLTDTGALVLDIDGREVVVTAGDVVHLRST